MSVLGLVLVVFLLSQAIVAEKKREILEPNWDDFKLYSEINRAELVQFLRNFPLHSYWDTLKGEYRTGALGEHVQSLATPSHLSLITWVDKQVLQSGKLVKIHHPIVDHNLLFMIMLVAIQDLSQLSEHLLHLSGGYQQQYDFKKMLDVINQQNLTTSADVEAKVQIAKLEGKILALQREVDARRTAFALLSEEQQKEYRQQARTSLHQKLLQKIHDSALAVNSIYSEKWKALDEQLTEEVNADYERQRQQLEREFAESVKDLESEIETTFAIIAYRAHEERKAIDMMEEITTRVTSVQAQSHLQGTEEILNVVSSEITAAIKEMVQDPWFVWVWGRLILGIVVSVVVVIELSRSLHVLLYHWQRRSRTLYSQQQHLPSWKTALFGATKASISSSSSSLSSSLLSPSRRVDSIQSGDDVVRLLEEESKLVFNKSSPVSTEVSNASITPREKLRLVARDVFVAVNVHARPSALTFAAFANHAATPLPNLLFYGPAGCGKSETARQLAHSVAQDPRASHYQYSGYIVLSGADLLALGEQAGHYVREIFQRYGHGQSLEASGRNRDVRRTTLLIIDEADEIICTRDTVVAVASRLAIETTAPPSAKQPNVLFAHRRTLPPEEETPTEPPSSETDQAPPVTIYSTAAPVSSTGDIPQASPHHVLYSLLEGLRTPNLSLSVVFTTRLPLTHIDSALLDRMDHVLPFPRPGAVEAMDYLLLHVMDILADVFPTGENHVQLQQQLQVWRENETAREALLRPVLAGDTWTLCKALFLPPSTPTVGHLDTDPFRDDVSVLSTTSSTASARRQSQRLLKRNNVALTSDGTDQDPELSHRPPTTAASSYPSLRTTTPHRRKGSAEEYASPMQQFLAERRADMVASPVLRSQWSLETCLQLMVMHACRLPLQGSASSLRPTTSNKRRAATSPSVSSIEAQGWSYRDFNKKLMNIRYTALCSEACRVNDHIWLDEILQME